MSYCTYCGTKNREGALFCKNCGKPMSEAKEDNNVEQPAGGQTVVEEPVVVEESIAEQPVPAASSIVEIPIETPAVAPQPALQPAPQPVVTPVVPPVAPQPQPAPVAPQPQPKVEPSPEVASAPKYDSDLLERVAKPRNKGKITIILLIPLFLALIGIGVGAFFLFKAAKTVKEEVSSTMETINIDNDMSSDDAVANEDDSDAEEAEDTEEAEATEAEESVDEVNTADATLPSSASLSTKAKPSMADFQGWFINGAMKSGKPDGVNTLSSLSDINGSWKAFLFLDPSNKNGEKAQTFATMTFDGTNDKIKIHLKRFYTHFFNGNEIMDESSEAPDFFSARWKSGQLIASGVGSFIISDFWEQGGKQYAVGTFTTQDGISAPMGLVRP